jgi:hypothetical protein
MLRLTSPRGRFPSEYGMFLLTTVTYAYLLPSISVSEDKCVVPMGV